MDTIFDLASHSALHDYKFYQEILSRSAFRLNETKIETSLEADELFDLIIKDLQSKIIHRASDGYQNSYLVLEYESAVIKIAYYSSRNVFLSVASMFYERTLDILNKIKEVIPQPIPETNDHVGFNFFMLKQDGTPEKLYRSLLAPSWDDVKKNYPSQTRSKLDELDDLNPEKVGDGGKLVLLHGPPGLGKSYAIRALMRTFKSWAIPNYLADPERFFTHPQYMFSVLLNNENDQNDKWNIIIAEDSDEFIRIDAKEHSGQGLSRLLNLTDGILGQGMRVIFLLTTNEPIKNLHPAIIRPGRCLANIEFKLFDPTEACTWLGENSNYLAKGEYSLAKLYDLKRERQQIYTEKELVATGQYI